MPKQLISIRISDATRQKLDRLAEHHGTQTEAVAIAIDRLYQAEKPEEPKMTRDEIIDRLNADDWSTVVSAFDGLDSDAVGAELDAMFPAEANQSLARAIAEALHETRICIHVIEDNGQYQIHPNATPEAWADVVSNRDVSEAVPVEQLSGWGRWANVYRVQYRDNTHWYFVDATPDEIVG